jgi:hypothetical protein
MCNIFTNLTITPSIENAKVALEETFQREVTGMFQNKIKEELADEETPTEDSVDEQVSSGIGRGVGKSNAPKKQPKTKVVKQPKEKFFEEAEIDEDAQITSEGADEELGLGSGDTSAEQPDGISDEELEEILSSLEEEFGKEDPTAAPAPTDPNAPVAPAGPTDPTASAPAPAPVDASAPAPSPAPSPAPAPAPSPAPVDAAPKAPGEEEQPPVAEADEYEEIDLDELLSELGQENSLEEEKECDDCDEKDKDDELKNEVVTLKSQLNEHIRVIEFLRGQINEINLLNAKLLYTNKLFKQFGLSNTQKLNIVEKFDLTNTLREVKLTYTVLADQLNSGASTVNKKNAVAKSITEGLASKPIASTKPSKDVIVENTDQMASRFKQLAGIRKK